jgi:hypothetical protein
MDNDTRMAEEMKVIERLVEELLIAGYRLSVNDGEEITLAKSTDKAAILKAMRTTDEDYLLVHFADNRRIGTIYLVYGNMPWEVVNDYSDSVSVNGLLDKFEKFTTHMADSYYASTR